MKIHERQSLRDRLLANKKRADELKAQSANPFDDEFRAKVRSKLDNAIDAKATAHNWDDAIKARDAILMAVRDLDNSNMRQMGVVVAAGMIQLGGILEDDNR